MLYTARLDGTEPQRVLTPPLSGSLADYQLSAVRWSPDGTRVVVNRSLRRDAAYPSTDLVLVSLPDGREIHMQPMAVDVAGARTELAFAPRYGQHTRALLAEAGLAAADVQALHDAGVVA